jgi:hypothetical protein
MRPHHLHRLQHALSFVFLSFATVVFIAPTSAVANLIVNSGFDTPVVTSPSGYEYRTGSSIDNWNIVTFGSGSNVGEVQFNATYHPVGAGFQSLQMVTPADYIYQSFATSVGTLYHVSFDLSAYDSNGGILGVSVGGPFQDFTGTNAFYTSYSFDFTATALTSTLTFRDDGTFNSRGEAFQFPHFDNVVVNAAALPDAGSTFSLLSLALAALVGASRLCSFRAA